MYNFNSQDDETRQLQYNELSECARQVGGVNSFLLLLEALRKCKPHPLTAKDCEFNFPMGSIKWSKAIFEDKLNLLLQARLTESKYGNLLPRHENKNYKSVMNLVRTLKPIVIEVRPKNATDGEGFTVYPFEVIDENTTRLNPIFDALFFCSLDAVKKVLNYEPKVQ